MRIQFALHVHFEDPGAILKWAETRGHDYRITRLYAGEELPSLEHWEWLIVMGGPMSIHDEVEHPWLKREKETIAAAISNNKTVIGFCLGAQFIADALGAKVYPNEQKEIGWYPVNWTKEAQSALNLEALPAELTVFHWHGETYDLPEGATLLASSAACENQAFSYGNNVFGFQFHLEMLQPNIVSILENCRDELATAPYIQSESEIIAASPQLIEQATKLLHDILDQIEAKWMKTK
jgi:GMP synthase-like glutamine amidotransferase